MELPQDGLPEIEEIGEFDDLPPEFCHYRDEGCDLAGSCLDCPFPVCVYDEPGGGGSWKKRRRNAEMVMLSTSKGVDVKELALMFGVSQRTVQRVLREYRLKEDLQEDE